MIEENRDTDLQGQALRQSLEGQGILHRIRSYDLMAISERDIHGSRPRTRKKYQPKTKETHTWIR